METATGGSRVMIAGVVEFRVPSTGSVVETLTEAVLVAVIDDGAV
jgi:hypothetical protein